MIRMSDITKIGIEIIALSELKDKNGKFKYDEASKQFPMMDDRTFELHKSSMDNSKQIEPIIIHFSNIVDGRNRCKALDELGEDTVKVRRLPNNCTQEERMVLAKEIEDSRKKPTPTQIACASVKEFFRLKKLGKKVSEKTILSNSSASQQNFRHAKWLYKNQPNIFERLFNGEAVVLADPKKPTQSLAAIRSFYDQMEKDLDKAEEQRKIDEALALEQLDEAYSEEDGKEETITYNGKLKAYESIDTFLDSLIEISEVTIEEYLSYKWQKVKSDPSPLV